MKQMSLKKVEKKKPLLNGFKPRVRTRHPSHQVLRDKLPRMPFRCVIRLGSETPEPEVQVECNTVESVKNSSSKLRMKECFTKAGVTTAPWCKGNNIDTGNINEKGFKVNGNDCQVKEFTFPVIVKSLHGSRGRGNSKISNDQDLRKFIATNDLKNYIIEEYKSYLREYRLHVTEEGCFYTCRKMLKRDTPEDKRFQRHDDNCVWIVEENPQFDKPTNWDAVVNDCVKALKSLGLDIGAFDLKIQSAKTKDGKINENPEWIVIESCSAPSFGDITAQKYIEQIPKVLLNKFNKSKGF